MRRPKFSIFEFALFSGLLLALGLAAAKETYFCFPSTNGTDGHCKDKEWGPGEEAPAGCICQQKASEDNCACTCGAHALCVKRFRRQPKNANSSDDGNRYMCACADHFHLYVGPPRNPKNKKAPLQRLDPDKLGTCIKNGANKGHPSFSSLNGFATLLLLVVANF